MLARTLLDRHYRDLQKLTMALAEVLRKQVADIDAAVLQVDEANLPGSPQDGPVQRQQETDDDERLRRGLDRHPPELEDPGRQAREHDGDDGDESASREAFREQPEEEDRGEAEDCGETARDLRPGTGHPEDRREEVRVDRALVVVVGPEEEREPRSVLVAEALRERVGVQRERGLVPVIPGRVRGVDPQLEGTHAEDDAEPEEECGPLEN